MFQEKQTSGVAPGRARRGPTQGWKHCHAECNPAAGLHFSVHHNILLLMGEGKLTGNAACCTVDRVGVESLSGPCAFQCTYTRGTGVQGAVRLSGLAVCTQRNLHNSCLTASARHGSVPARRRHEYQEDRGAGSPPAPSSPTQTCPTCRSPNVQLVLRLLSLDRG